MDMQLAGTLEEAHSAQPTSGGDLDTDVVLAILRYSSVETLQAVGATCRQWRELAKEPSLWGKLYQVRVPDECISVVHSVGQRALCTISSWAFCSAA